MSLNAPSPNERDPGARVWSRRRLLGYGALGAGALVGAAAGLFELVDHQVLPGHQELITLLGHCDVSTPPADFSPFGPTMSGAFDSVYRHQRVGYTIAYPTGHGPGDRLPLVLAFHGFGGDHRQALAAFSYAQALALHVDGEPLPPMAIAAADGGGGYWHAHPHDDSLGMVVHELLPLCQAKGLGTDGHKVGAIGVSMGGYGALNLAEHEPALVSAVAAVSPAVWRSYAEAQAANAGAFGSTAEFSANDVITHAGALGSVPVRVASGLDDPFHPGVEALVRVLPPGAEVDIRKGCHDGGFFRSAEPAALAFLARHLVA